MASIKLVRNSIENIVEVFIVGSSGNGSTGIPPADINITAFAMGKSGGATPVTPVVGTIDTFISNGWIEVDAVNKKGVYQYSIPNVLMTTADTNVFIIFNYVGAGTADSVAYQCEMIAVDSYLGVKLSSDGLDFVGIEGINARQAIQLMASVLCGETTGAQTNKTLFKAVGNNGIERVGSTVDEESGDRTEVTISPST